MEKIKLLYNFDQKAVDGTEVKDGTEANIQILLKSWKGCIKQENMCLSCETSNSFEMAIKVGCAKKNN